MEKLLKNIGFSDEEIGKLCPEIDKFLGAEHEIQRIKKDIKTIKISLILIVCMVALSVVS